MIFYDDYYGKNSWSYSTLDYIDFSKIRPNKQKVVETRDEPLENVEKSKSKESSWIKMKL